MHSTPSSASKISMLFVLWLAIASFSLALFFWQIANFQDLPAFWQTNRSGLFGPSELFGYFIGSFALLCLIACSILMKIRTSSLSIMPGLTAATHWYKRTLWLVLIPLFFQKNFWRSDPFIALALLLGYALAFLGSLRKNGVNWWPFAGKLSRSRENLLCYCILFFAVVGYGLYFSYYTMVNHWKFGTYAYDLGYNQNAILNTLRENFMKVSYTDPYTNLSETVNIHDHFTPIYLLWLPLYALWTRSETLLAMQSITVAAGAIPLFLLTDKLLRSKKAALTLSLLYLLNPAQHSANFYDIHELSFLPVLMFFLFFFYETKRYVGYYCCLALCLCIKQDMALLLLFAVVFLFWRKKRLRHFLLSSAVCLFWFFLTYKVLPFFMLSAPGTSFSFHYACLIPKDSYAPVELVKLILTNPFYVMQYILSKNRVLYFLLMSVPFFFLPFLSKKNLILFLYGFCVTLLACRYTFHSIFFQYIWYLLPFMFIGTIYSLRTILLKERYQSIHRRNFLRFTVEQNGFFKPLLLTIVFLSVILSYQYGAVLDRREFVGGFHAVDFTFTDHDRIKLDALKELRELIPPKASITASEAICPHLDRFTDVRTFRFYRKETDYLLLFQKESKGSPLARRLIETGKYALIKENKYFVLWINAKLKKDQSPNMSLG